jgi:hypothetical protein
VLGVLDTVSKADTNGKLHAQDSATAKKATGTSFTIACPVVLGDRVLDAFRA